ncbi:hypothetical protein HGRIS_003835 [Hohenbuehelia grisea]|uniref:Uncharacterized protein n=1 Tax=Hohenbuehelia grisea TaxID=104357 RepID=A0ABR3JHN3_9AGAR
MSGNSEQEAQSFSMPNRLWEMILRGSPDLEQLHFLPYQTRPMVTMPLLTGSFPKLRSLTLGNSGFPPSIDAEGHGVFAEFLASHLSLAELALIGSNPPSNPWRFATHHSSLRRIRRISCNVEFAIMLRNAGDAAHITEMCLDVSMPISSETGPWDDLLKQMTSLVSLKLIAGHSCYLLFLLGTCVPLVHFEAERLELPITFRTMANISNALKFPSLAQLKTLVLSFGNGALSKFSDHDIQEHARCIFRANPRLCMLTLKYNNRREGFPDHLMQQGVFERLWVENTIAVREVNYIRGYAATKRYRLAL